MPDKPQNSDKANSDMPSVTHGNSRPKATQAVIVAVGTELLFGSTINTNAAEISKELHNIGIGVLAHLTIGDNPVRLKRTLEIAFEMADIVLVTGGLGPTQDDLTKEMIAEFFDAPLEFDEESMRRIIELFERIGRDHYTKNNEKQAYFPKGSSIFYNDLGTAPGFAYKQNERLIFALPGPPREMRPMMSNYVVPYLAGLSKYTIYSKDLVFTNIGESVLETVLMPLIDGQSDPTIATYAKVGECTVRITSMRENADEAKAAVEQMAAQAQELVRDHVLLKSQP